MSNGKVIYDLFGDRHQARTEVAEGANDTKVNEAPPEYLQSSKKKFARLNPYFQTILIELATSSFDKYVLPDDLYSKLAEALSIRNRGDVYSIDLMLTVGKLQPFIARKTGLKWSTIEKDIIRPIIKQFRAEHYSANVYTLDTIPNTEWFPPLEEMNKPDPWYMNIALALI
jgi:hypothetical protein